jgi:hypothetical protein
MNPVVRYVLVASCLGPLAAAAQEAGTHPTVTLFSSARPGGGLPGGWSAIGFGTNKPATEYKLVDDAGKTVLHAHADHSSSALSHRMNVDIGAAPVLQWRWKISNVIAEADNSSGSKEDAPARIVLGFDGDKSKLGFKDRAAATIAKNSSGRELPYAQLVYIWSTAAPVGSVIRHPHSDRVRMIVASSGSAETGKWVALSRNVHDDFKRAFAEEPGKLTEIGVLTDSDNTGATVDAWYGDIRFVSASGPAAKNASKE